MMLSTETFSVGLVNRLTSVWPKSESRLSHSRNRLHCLVVSVVRSELVFQSWHVVRFRSFLCFSCILIPDSLTAASSWHVLRGMELWERVWRI